MYKFGDLYYADLPLLPGSCMQQGRRPVVIVSNNKFNQYSTMVSVAPLTSKLGKHPIPTHVNISGYGLKRESIILVEQTRPLDQCRLQEQIGTIMDQQMRNKIWQALMIQFDIVA
ncbi:MAG: type II toxin-antitoxin system PemK/MazF family toxin [Lachnospiraceae bacterium]